MGKVITFLHFSDIHFNKQSDSIYCLDKDLRNEMIIDVQQVTSREDLQPYGIIICGDVAYSGKDYEYEIADDFINKLVENLKIEYEHVFCVPGNHDVNQEITSNMISVYAVQKLLEEADDCKFQDYLDKLKVEAEITNDDVLYRPLESYNNFAGKYMGNVSSMDAPWTHEIMMDEGYTLCLYGINSTIISNIDDHRNRDKTNLRKMRIGKHQLPMRQEKFIYMTVCHHPTDNWVEDISQALDARAMIQLYGHKHVQTLEQSTKRIKIGTGALQPDRREDGWQPRYNFLSVKVNTTSLEVKLYPRIWDDSKKKFVRDKLLCDGEQLFKKIILPLEHIQSTSDEMNIYSKVRDTSDEKRKMVYKLWGLQAYERGKVMQHFDVFNSIQMSDLNKNIEEILSIAEKNDLFNQIIERIDKIND